MSIHSLSHTPKDNELMDLNTLCYYDVHAFQVLSQNYYERREK